MHQPYLSPLNPGDFERPSEIYLAPLADDYPAPERDITFGRVLWHLLLLGLTAVTTSIMGAIFLGGLTAGMMFSFTLLMILGAHEMGHYLAARLYDVRATLPYFLPAPIGIGTFGAFIKMKSPIPNKRALFDIGIAGPLAGFVFIIPAAIIGVYFADPAVGAVGGGDGIVFHDPLLFRAIAKLLGVPHDIQANPIWLASWVGCLVTSLNLLPVGQLDGGHGTFAVFGQRAHKIIGRVAFVTVAVMSVLGFIWHGSPSGFLYTVLLAVMLKVRHPAPEEMEPLGRGRTVVAIITLIVFALSFVPFPITIT